MASSGVFIDGQVLGQRLAEVYDAWQSEGSESSGFGNGSRKADALVIATGKTTEDLRYMKSIALELWLFAYELPETVIVLLRDGQAHVVTGKTKAALISQCKDECVAKSKGKVSGLHIHIRPKGTTGEDQFKQVLEEAKKAKQEEGDLVVGNLPKDKHEGIFFGKWSEVLSSCDGASTFDASPGFAKVLTCKSSEEQTSVKKASYLATQAMRAFVVPQLETIVDEEKKVKHSTLAGQIEDRILEPSKLEVRLKQDKVNICYAPIIQSGGKYDLKITAQSDDALISYDTIVCSLGARYASYCSNVSRTVFVDPTKEQERYYAALLKAHQAVVNAAREGRKLSELYVAARESFISSECAELVPHLGRNVGFGMGLEFRESAYTLSEKNSAAVVKPGMVFNVCLSLSGIKNKAKDSDQPAEYAMQLADTVLVAAGGNPAEVLTEVPKQWKDVAYFLNEEDDEEEEDAKVKKEEVLPAKRSSALRARDGEGTEKDKELMQAEGLRRERQDELTRKANEETLRYLTQSKHAGDDDKSKEIVDPVSYKSSLQVPSSKDLLIVVDQRSESVVLPLYGICVPFHISVVKNVSTSSDTDHAFVRIIFQSPSVIGAVSPLVQRHMGNAFLKEASFRCTDVKHANRIVQDIKTMKRLVQQRESEKRERATLVAQEKLVPTKGRVPVLSDVWIRPTLGGRGKKMTGSLEAHSNGFRYHSPKGEQLDVVFGNIKHAFFQPAEKEMICLVHFHLHDEIMVGKKKSRDVQFYTEVMEVVQTLDAGRRNTYDPDEIEEEQRERERRNKVNNQYNSFVKKVQDLWERDHRELSLEFDIPFRELGFTGVPNKSTSFLIPTVYCLVDLIEVPFFVLTLSEIAVVNLERVGFGLKNFDMVFVFKDFDKEPHRVDAIPSAQVEQVKEWLTSMNIKYYENKMNLVWKPILKTIKEDPEAFINDGGWEFLNMEASESDEDAEQSESFEPDSDEDEDDDEDDDEESDFDEDEEEEEDDDDEFDDDEEEEGKTWEELEEEARRSDKKRSHEQDSDEERRRHRGRSRR